MAISLHSCQYIVPLLRTNLFGANSHNLQKVELREIHAWDFSFDIDFIEIPEIPINTHAQCKKGWFQLGGATFETNTVELMHDLDPWEGCERRSVA